jgi:hypothetical protein
MRLYLPVANPQDFEREDLPRMPALSGIVFCQYDLFLAYVNLALLSSLHFQKGVSLPSFAIHLDGGWSHIIIS